MHSSQHWDYLPRPNKKLAYELFHELMGKSARPPKAGTVEELLDDFLVWSFQNNAERTANTYRDFFKSFVGLEGRHWTGQRTVVARYGALLVEDLTPNHVSEWIAANESWNETPSWRLIVLSDMIDRVYSHVADDADFMLEVARRGES